MYLLLICVHGGFVLFAAEELLLLRKDGSTSLRVGKRLDALFDAGKEAECVKRVSFF